MLSINAFVRLTFLVLPAFASGELLPVKRAEGEPVPDSYVVLLKDGYNVATIADSMPMNVTHQWTIVNGFSAILGEPELNKLRSDPAVSTISENEVVRISVKQTDAPWGLQRISHREPVQPKDAFALDYTYIYDDSAGNGVDVYVIDTGIQIDHPEFQGRARWGATFGGYLDADGNGHGTHCSGTVASLHYGVSKKTNLIAVKVLSDAGFGSWSDVISGIDWVAANVPTTGRPSVASMSIQGGAFDPVDEAVTNLVNSGVPIAIAAGNFAEDVSFDSPGRTPAAITVGAMDINDDMASFSNYGALVDIFAPGVNVWSTWIGSSTNIISGTSMATPHVAGFVAYLYGLDSTLTVQEIEAAIDCYATRDALTLTDPAIQAGTVNKLLYNNYQEYKW